MNNPLKRPQLFVSSLLLCSIPSFAVHAQHPLTPMFSVVPFDANASKYIQQLFNEDHVLSYDAILGLLDQIENEELDCSPEDWNQICHFLAYLARQGMLPCDSEAEKAELERDIEKMLDSCSDFERVSYFLGSNEYSIASAMYYYDGVHAVLCKSWIHKQWNHVKHFAKHHKTAMIVGAILVVAAVVVVATMAITSSTAAAAAAAAAAATDSDKHKSKAPDQSQTTIEEQVAVLKDTATENNVLTSLVQNDGISDSEQGRVLGSILAHEAINETAYNTFPISSQIFDPISAGHGVTDHAFSTEQSIHYLNKEPSSNGLENHLSSDLFHQEGEQALKLGNYEQAIEHFDQAIAADSQNHDAYLQRATAYMELGEYNNSLRDYRTYSAHERPNQSFFSNTIDFGVGFATGLPKGVGESGHQLLTFASEAATHPIDTTCNVCSAFSNLAKLATSREWEALSQSLAPEVCQLASEWDSLSAREQGERAGYVFGKYGGDILIPGTTAKVLSKGLNGAKELVSVVKNLQTTEQTFALETLAQSVSHSNVFMDVSTVYKELQTIERTPLLESGSGVKNGVQIAQIIQLEQQISEWLGESVQFIRNEAGDPVFLSKDGLKCVRFDFNYPNPHKNPHAHVEIKVNGKWVKSGQIYPIDVPHN